MVGTESVINDAQGLCVSIILINVFIKVDCPPIPARLPMGKQERMERFHFNWGVHRKGKAWLPFHGDHQPLRRWPCLGCSVFTV
jgi:hypothetical protein